MNIIEVDVEENNGKLIMNLIKGKWRGKEEDKGDERWNRKEEKEKRRKERMDDKEEEWKES